jgi:hypothetical protein
MSMNICFREKEGIIICPLPPIWELEGPYTYYSCLVWEYPHHRALPYTSLWCMERGLSNKAIILREARSYCHD